MWGSRPPVSSRPGEEAFSTHYSDVALAETRFCPSRIAIRHAKPPFRLVAVGSLEQLYKAPDVLLNAIGDVPVTVSDLELAWIGGGKYQPQLEAKARVCAWAAGPLPWPGAGRRGGGAELDRADLFVLCRAPRDFLERSSRPWRVAFLASAPQWGAFPSYWSPGTWCRPVRLSPWLARSAKSSLTLAAWHVCLP